jgi:hypothetical protein
MKIEAVVGMVFICATILFLFYASVGDASASTLYVPDNYLTIQAAVDAANAGGVVIVRAGTLYRECKCKQAFNNSIRE